MIRSMTGFGRGQASEAGFTYTVEARSVNNRYTEVNVRLPRALAVLEKHVVDRVQTRVARGSVTVLVSVESANGDAAVTTQQVVADVALAQEYRRALDQLRASLGFTEPVNLEMLIRQGDIITTKQAAVDEDLAVRLIDAALDAALVELDEMRAKEGETLAADFRARLDLLSSHTGDVETRAPERVEEAKRRLEEKVAALLQTDIVDPQRLALEVTLLAERSDITEECVRFRSHLDQFDALMRQEATGRKLNFLLQEMNREVNTIGSKANDARIAHIVVQMKDEIERLREQVQNIE